MERYTSLRSSRGVTRETSHPTRDPRLYGPLSLSRNSLGVIKEETTGRDGLGLTGPVTLEGRSPVKREVDPRTDGLEVGGGTSGGPGRDGTFSHSFGPTSIPSPLTLEGMWVVERDRARHPSGWDTELRSRRSQGTLDTAEEEGPVSRRLMSKRRLG